MTGASEEQAPRAADSGPLERSRASVSEYIAPFEPVGIEDWEALNLEDDTDTSGGSA